jgi:hypothetical protein
MLVLMNDTQKVVSVGLVIEHRAIVHVVLEDSESAVLPVVDLPKQRYFLSLLLEDLHTIGTHVFEANVVRFSRESCVGEHLIGIDIALEFACHTKIVHKKRSLIDVLEKTESAIL